MTCSWGGLGPAPAANLPTVASFFSLPHRLLQLQSILSLREHTQLNLLPTLTCKHLFNIIFFLRCLGVIPRTTAASVALVCYNLME